MLKRINTTLNDLSLAQKGIVTLAIPLAILLLSLGVFSYYEHISRKAQARVSHSLEVKAALYEVLSSLVNSESAVRGYLLWERPYYLEPYNEGYAKYQAQVKNLKDLVVDNAEQAARVETIEAIALAKYDVLQHLLDNPSAVKNPESQWVQNGRTTMDTFRKAINEMSTREDMLLSTRITQYNRLMTQINWVLGVLFLLGLASGIIASYIISTSILRRVNNLERHARRVTRGETPDWHDDAADELGQLGRNMQTMTKTLLQREEALEQTRAKLQHANSSLEKLLRETRAANQELESFSYSVSHDLRAPLRHVAGFSELLLRNADNLDPKNRRYLDIISKSISQMGVLIDELLAFSRMGRTALKSDPVHLNDVINDVINDLSPDITQRAIQWTIPELPTVHGDRMMIQLVFQNLISNALKYTRDRTPAQIDISCEYLPETHMESITIKDNGVGFDMAYADKLFGVFQRLHSSEEYEGTGIGLATVRRIVQRHGGDVKANSTVGEGAQFTITLPSDRIQTND